MSDPYPRVLGHIGLTVQDIDTAFEWYQDVLGFTPVVEPQKVIANEGRYGKLSADAIGYDYGEMYVAHLATGNHVGIEMFEFEETSKVNDPTPADPGLFHLCVQDPNVKELAETIIKNDGEQISDIWELHPDYPEYQMCYCADPWGNIVEIHSRGYEHMKSNLD
jgi:catechol 2,3-dioxygenase-like lactoylglutathione lyase family enzyme